MEHQKILNSLNEANDPKFVTRKWNIVNDQLNTSYDAGNEIIYNTEVLKVLKSNFCDYNQAYILVRSDIVTTAHNIPTEVPFKNCAPFIKCVIKIDGTTIDDAEDLDLVMPLYNQIEHSSNYSETTGSLWFCADIANNNNNFKTFEYKAKLLGNTEADGNSGILKNATIAVPLKYLSKFWRSLKCH